MYVGEVPEVAMQAFHFSRPGGQRSARVAHFARAPRAWAAVVRLRADHGLSAAHEAPCAALLGPDFPPRRLGIAPVELDPWSLETIGSHDFDGQLNSAMTAHIHRDPRTGEMIGFGRQVGGPGSPFMTHQIVDANGALTHDLRFEAPYCALLHDFAITDDHVIYPLGPAILDPTRPKRGEPVLMWEGDRPSYLGIMSREGHEGQPRWIPMDPCFMWHTLNAFSEEGMLYVDLIKYNKLPRYDAGEDVRTASNPEDYAGKLVRWRVPLDASTDTVHEEKLDDLIKELSIRDKGQYIERHSTKKSSKRKKGRLSARAYYDGGGQMSLQKNDSAKRW